jgi:hypothetical protein
MEKLAIYVVACSDREWHFTLTTKELTQKKRQELMETDFIIIMRFHLCLVAYVLSLVFISDPSQYLLED